ILLFVLCDLAVVLFVILPSVIYLFLLDNDLSERELVFYVIALVSLQTLVTGLLLRKFPILPGQPTEDRDAC
ncbi:MAG: hypothetical protein ACK5JT_01390, partial [Hyphomicrobiaceae bacterium]